MSGKDVKVLIFYDMEGVSGINDWRQVAIGQKEYEESGRQLLTEDINAAVRGLRAAGATEIGIVNFHGASSNHVIPEKLENGVKILGPALSKKMMEFLDKSVAAILIGFHGMANTKDGFLSHTVTPGQVVKINGKEIGEPYIIAIALSEYSIPVIMATGDQTLVKQTSEFIPGIDMVQVKNSINKRTTECLPVEEARTLIEKTATSALSRRDSFKIVQVQKPIKIEVIFQMSMQAELVSLMPRAERSAENAVSYTAETPFEAIRFEYAANIMSSQVETTLLMMQLNRLKEVQKKVEKFFEKRVEQWLSS